MKLFKSRRPKEHFLTNAQDASSYALVDQSGLFDRDWYLSANADVAASGMDALAHYLEHGWKEGRNPSAGFDSVGYAQKFQRDNQGIAPLLHCLREGHAQHYGRVSRRIPDEGAEEERTEVLDACRDIEASDLFDRDAYLTENPDVANSGVDPLRHYVENGWREGRNPGPFFDASWYLHQNPDIALAGINPLLHYVRSGQREGRAPNAFFDPQWYETTIVRTEDEADGSPFAIFWARGVTAGHAPLPELKPVYACRTAVPVDAHDQYVRLVAAARPWWNQFGRWKFAILVALFSPFGDRPGLTFESDDPVERLIAFLLASWTSEIEPGPLFKSSHYLRKAEKRAGKLPKVETALQHFLREGFDTRVVPTPYFDEKYYYRTYPDILGGEISAFEHFIRWGVFEGRRASGRPRPVVAQKPLPIADTDARLHNWKHFLSACGNGSALGDAYQNVPHYAQITDDILHSAVFAETMRRAAAIEPAIGDVSDIADVLVPPFHDGRDLARRALRDLLARDHYDTVVCVPWIRTGGADLVACQICEAVKIAHPNESVLLIRTDQPNFDRPEWIPEGVDVVDASGVFRNLPPNDAQLLLYGLFMGLAPARVINVNSRLCWDTMARFGARLAESIGLYSYLFCWDQTPSGYRVGYPSEFFPETANNLRAVFTDTVYLKSELVKIYNLPTSLGKRIVPLFSPSRGHVDGPTAAQASVRSAEKRRRWRILWAGRLDRQKRFDLVQEIARRIPDADFLCWGTALLDAPPDHSRSPDNLHLYDGFSSYDELPLYDADLWLFTSEWEGMPTILIELAHRGVSVVASSVGGVPELIDDQTGWPVDDVHSVAAYVMAIRTALASPKERIVRADRLRDRARGKHSMTAYAKQVADVLNKGADA